MKRRIFFPLSLLAFAAFALAHRAKAAEGPKDDNLILIQVVVEDMTDPAKPVKTLTMGGRCHPGQPALLNWASPHEPYFRFQDLTADVVTIGESRRMLATTVTMSIASRREAKPVALQRTAQVDDGQPFVVGAATVPVGGKEHCYVVVASALREKAR